MNEQLVLIAIGVVAAALILRPLLRGKTSRSRAEPSSLAPTTATSEELNELELDRAMGRVSDEDYAKWRRELEVAAPPEAPPAVAPPVDAASRAEALVRQWREAPRPVCPRCGIRPEPEARFCSNCGATLTP
jgi:cytochrome c-type biogenesis protein CcmI